jgi:hypothetical protein
LGIEHPFGMASMGGVFPTFDDAASGVKLILEVSYETKIY